jgi:cell division protein FtsQ
MKIIKIIISFLLVLGILILMVWAALKSNDQNCTDISIVIHSPEKSELLTKSDISNILKHHNISYEEKTIKEIDLEAIHKILAQENYIQKVDKVHFLGSKLQIEVTLYDILLEVEPTTGQKFLVDVQGTYLPFSPKVENDVIVATGFISNTFQEKEKVSSDNNSLYELFSVATLIKTDPFYTELFHNLFVKDNQEIVLYPSVGNLPVRFGSAQDAENKLKTLKYMYHEVLPYMDENAYAQLDVRFKNRIIATKTKS